MKKKTPQLQAQQSPSREPSPPFQSKKLTSREPSPVLRPRQSPTFQSVRLSSPGLQPKESLEFQSYLPFFDAGFINEQDERLTAFIATYPRISWDLPRRFLLGSSKIFSIITIIFSFYSFLTHGKDNTQLTRDEIKSYLIPLLILSPLGGFFEMSLRFYPRYEMWLLPYWNAAINGFNNALMKFLFIFDGNCVEVDQPLCNEYNDLILILKIMTAPILIYSLVPTYTEYSKYNSLDRYIKQEEINENLNFIKTPFLRTLTMGMDTAIGSLSSLTHIIKVITMFKLFFLNEEENNQNTITLWSLKLGVGLVGFFSGIMIDLYLRKHSKKLFCINEFFQTLLINGYSGGVAYVLSLIFFAPPFQEGVDTIKGNLAASLPIFIVFGSLGVFPILSTIIKVHDQYRYKFLNKEQLEEINSIYTTIIAKDNEYISAAQSAAPTRRQSFSFIQLDEADHKLSAEGQLETHQEVEDDEETEKLYNELSEIKDKEPEKLPSRKSTILLMKAPHVPRQNWCASIMSFFCCSKNKEQEADEQTILIKNKSFIN